MRVDVCHKHVGQIPIRASVVTDADVMQVVWSPRAIVSTAPAVEFTAFHFHITAPILRILRSNQFGGLCVRTVFETISHCPETHTLIRQHQIS